MNLINRNKITQYLITTTHFFPFKQMIIIFNNFHGYHLTDMLGQYSVNKLKTTVANALESPLTENELGNALKHIKHKTVGINGFPSEDMNYCESI